jgi:hypothetical protein
MRRIVLALTVALAATTAALAADPQPAQMSDALNKKVCRPFVHEGLLLRSNSCHTAKEWDALMRQQQREILEEQVRSLVQNS